MLKDIKLNKNRRDMKNKIKTIEEFAKAAHYSLLDNLQKNPQSKDNGIDYIPREVKSGHYVPIKPTPIKEPNYISHSKIFFNELGLDDSLAQEDNFMKMFSADTSDLPSPLHKNGWACGYALSIYGREYYAQCPFGTGNGYGDGRAISIFEGLFDGNRWEMQLKGGGKTPYCRGADGRAVLRSSVREFLAQEHMHALGIPTSRSLTLYTSSSEKVKRPWFTQGSYSKDPEVMIEEKVAISTRVAPSFLRVGQLELFARRARKNEHSKAMEELKQIVSYAMEREYNHIFKKDISFEDKIIAFAQEFQERLTSLVTHWIRVGYCQGNFNSDNCAIGGFGLDYGPFGFMDMFDTRYQPWTGGGVHFSFLNQGEAARKNFKMFCSSLYPLLIEYPQHYETIEKLETNFPEIMYSKLENMWAEKLGLGSYDEKLFAELISLMLETGVDYTLFFRELSHVPFTLDRLVKSFYNESLLDDTLTQRWTKWLEEWRSHLPISSNNSKEQISLKMKQVNPKYTLREWILVPAYENANKGDYDLIYELQEIMNNPYKEQSKKVEEKYYKKKANELFDIAGVSHISCSS